jgi:4-hydroxy-tetrahydrodipicolinate reductase
MKLALIGYGKMGHAIERFALQRGHEITCRIDADNLADFGSPEFATSDVAIEFTAPTAAVGNYAKAFAAGVPVVSGTTGWTARRPEVEQMISEANATLLWSSNFSIGVNLFAYVNNYLASLMEGFAQYTPEMKEIHHIHKLDHPSGTAITLAEGIIAHNNRIDAWSEDAAETEARKSTMLIDHERQGEVPGTHIIKWQSPVDAITIEHRAFSRDGFALGAVMAAEWVHANPNRHGLLSMADMLENTLKH